MANLPELRSREMIIGDLIDGFLARVKDVNDLNRASVISQFFYAIGQGNFKAAANVITMVDALSVDRATGEALQRLAADAGVKISSGTYSSGRVTIRDLSFSKISTNIFSGQPAPVAGSTNLYVVDASKMNAAGGKLFIGRGTPNAEGPLNFTSVQAEAGGAYWSITLDVASPTTKFHNNGESIVVAQGGNRKINAGTVVRTLSGSGVSSVDFKTVSPATIPDGEVVVDSVPVVSTVIGPKGNVPRGSIREVVGLPFTSSSFNENAFVNGVPPDDEDAIRKKIKEAEQAKSKGTEQAIKIASVGVSSTDDLKKVQSSNILRSPDSSAALIFDDGGENELLFSGIGIEQVIDDALGGEKELQLRKFPVVSARVKSIEVSPFKSLAGKTLSVTVQGEETSHYFQESDFRVIDSATSYEVTSSINGNPNLNFLATTSDGGNNIIIYPRDIKKNDITVNRISSNDANDLIGFQTTTQYTLIMYKNDRILYQDGLVAAVTTRLKSAWSTSISEGDTLIYSVDGTPEIQIIFTKEEFQKFDLTATVNAFTNIDVWIKVMNHLMTGVIVSKSGEQITMTSARGQSNDASIEILGGTLKDKIFTSGIAIIGKGKQSDYTLNRQTGQIGLNEALQSQDKISAGSSFTRANISTTQLSNGPSSAGNIWMVVDGGVKTIPAGIEGNTVTNFSKSLSKITIKSTAPNLDPVGFDQVVPGDWMVIWAEQSDNINYPSLFNFQGFWPVESVTRGEIIVDDGNRARGAGGPLVIPTDRITFVRTKAPVQKLSFTVGPLSSFITEIESGLEGIDAEVVGATVRISTITANSSGEIAIIAADSQGKAIGINVGDIVQNISSQKGFVTTEDSEAGMPSFSYDNLGSYIDDDQFVNPLYEEIGGTRDDFIEILNRYNIDSKNLTVLTDANKDRRIFVTNYDPSLDELNLDPKRFSQADSSLLKTGDRYFLRTSYQFDSGDTATVIVDGDIATKIFGLPVARKIIVNAHSTPSLNDFSADDGESSLALSNSSSFLGFDFNDWKVWRKASALLTDSATYGLRIQSADSGPAGDTIRVGLIYPKTIDQTSIDVAINNAEMIDVGIIIPIKTPRTPNWDATTSFTTSIQKIPGTGKDKVIYTYKIGTEPDFVGAGVIVGDLVLINNASDLLEENKAIEAKVVSVNATDFAIEIPADIAINDNIVISQGQNIGRTLTVTTPQSHKIIQGDRVGIFGTALADGLTAPMDGSYFATIIDDTNFTVPLGLNVPGGLIESATHSSNVVTIKTYDPHGLNLNNVIAVTGAGGVDGTAVVYKIIDANRFQFVKEGSSPSASSGRFDFQSLGSDFSVDISALTKTLGTVTVSTSAPHSLDAADVVQISGAVISTYGGRNEIQSIKNNKMPASGTFTLSDGVDTSAPLPYNASPGAVQAAINGFAAYSTVRVEGGFSQGGFVIVYEGVDGNTNQPQITTPSNSLIDGSAHNEFQKIGYHVLPSMGTHQMSYNGIPTGQINPLLGNAHVKTQIEVATGAGTVNVTGSAIDGYQVEFIGALANTNVFPLIPFSSSVLGVSLGTSTLLGTSNDIPVGANEKHRIRIDNVPETGFFKLVINGEVTADLTVAGGTAAIKSAIEALTIVSGFVTVTQINGPGYIQYDIEYLGNYPLLVPAATWLIATPYIIGNIVFFQGSNWKAITNSTGQAPGPTTLAFWEEVGGVISAIQGSQPLIGYEVAGSTVIAFSSGGDTIKFFDAGAYNAVTVGDYVEFTSGAFNGGQYAILSRSVILSDIDFGGVTTYNFQLANNFIGNLTNSNFSLKKPSKISATRKVSGRATPPLTPEKNILKVSTSVYNAVEVGERIRITSSPNIGAIYVVKSKTVIGLDNIIYTTEAVAATLVTGDGFEVRDLVPILTAPPLDGINGSPVTLTVNTDLAGITSAVYNIGDLVRYAGNTYVAIVSGATGIPNITPTNWAITTIDINGYFVVSNVLSPNQFTYAHYHTLGTNTCEQGVVIRQRTKAKLARSLGHSSSVLSFAEIGTTAQEIVDFVTQNKSDLLRAAVELPYTGAEPVLTSTKDNDIGIGFLIGTAISLKTTKASRVIEVTVNGFVREGSTIYLSSSNKSEYDGSYAVFSQRESGLNWIVTLQSTIFASTTTTTSLTSGVYQGETDYIALRDGENSVKITDLTSLIGNPQFQTKQPWNLIPTIGEEIRLVSTNTKQLTEFWNRLVVTGISNVASIENSEYDRQIQITTNKFGSSGSIQFTGGTANNLNIAIVGSGSELNGKVGVFKLPYELRKGINRKSWLRMEQTVRLNKITEFAGSTVLRVYPDSIEILGATPGSFQTKRITTADETSVIKIEKHGKFMAIIGIGGADLGLDVGAVQEGDWVRIINTPSTAYDVLANYSIGARVLSAGLNWTAIKANGPLSTVVNPIPGDEWNIDTEYTTNDIVTYENKAYIYTGLVPVQGDYPNDIANTDWELVWEVREWDGGNTGIFKVVRTFGSNSFWIENENGLEGMNHLGNSLNMAFYRYDSVMPGDTLVVSGNILSAANAGRYTVRDETSGIGYFFPTSTKIWTDPIAVASGVGGITLGDNYIQVNVEESSPMRAWKRVLAIGPGDSGLANVIVDSPNLMNRFSSSNAAYIEVQGKLGYDTVPSFGIDAYKSYGGLIKSLNRVIYGDPTSPAEYPGVRAAGTSIDIREAIIKRIYIALSVRVRTGISFNDIRESIKASVAGYVNNLGTGEQVALSKVVEAASKVNGVSSVVITSPAYNSGADRISIGAQEKPKIVDPSFDVTVSILST